MVIFIPITGTPEWGLDRIAKITFHQVAVIAMIAVLC